MIARDPTFLGTVQDVAGSRIHVVLDEQTLSGLTFIGGYGYRIGQVGAFVRIQLGYLDLYGIVSQVGAGAVPEKLADTRPHGDRWMTIQLAGQARRDGAFERGVAQYPTIGDRVHLVAEDDLRRIYGRPDHPQYVKIGSLAAAPSIPALIDIERLLTRHSAVVGATGSGKSTTVAGILNAVSDAEKYPSARIVLIDIHGEYARALGEKANVFKVGANPARGERELFIPYWALNFDELANIALGSLDDPARVAYVDKITSLKAAALASAPRAGVDEFSITVDTPIPFSIRKLWWDFYTELRSTHFEDKSKPQSQETWALETEGGLPVQPGDMMKVIPPKFRAIKDVKEDPEKIRWAASTLKVGRSIDILTGRLRDRRMSFLFSPGPWSADPNGEPEEDLGTLLKEWIGSEKPISILDLSGIPATVQGDLVGALLRILYEALFWGRYMPEGGRARPLLIVLEEAHAYLNSGTDSVASHAVQRIAKEGRKYGMGLMIVSQRPSEIHQTILSQCGTLFALRLSNSNDRSHITGSVSDGLEGLLAALPILRTGEAIVLGEAVTLPVRALIAKPPPDRRPDSHDPTVIADMDPESGDVGGWNQIAPQEDYEALVNVWRSQTIQFAKGDLAMVEWHEVESSTVLRIGYDAAVGELYVEFTNGSTYVYYDVPEQVFEAFAGSGSKGVFLNANIKGKYRFGRE
jgi:DNA helicase HerA-like ATPase